MVTTTKRCYARTRRCGSQGCGWGIKRAVASWPRSVSRAHARLQKMTMEAPT